jgi:hypothetical protein
MASSPAGEIFAAFNDVTTEQIDVWKSLNENGNFTRLSQPFPNLDVVSHPRLRYDPFAGALYVAAQAANGVIFLNRYKNGAWGTPVPASYPAAVYPQIKLSDRILRTGPQFSFDIGSPTRKEDEQQNDWIRVVYTIFDGDSKRYYIRGSYCPLDIQPGCWDAPQWGTTPGNFKMEGDQFNPLIRASFRFIGLESVWRMSYMTRRNAPAGNTVSIDAGNVFALPNGTRIFLPKGIVGVQLVCPDKRGYWGDYDDLQFVGFNKEGGQAEFIRTFSDSTQGCNFQWQYLSQHLHVSTFSLE